MKLVRMIACLVMWGLVVMLAACYGLGAGLAALGLILSAAIICVAEEEISKGE